ncbi:hypothetical protein PROFUN_13843 [Planoprotostelium fungivorum]|uniref:Uncharacterized protein n=1 Tax=Planoprotostelium fungivorum TaxID=1890364 RepID=A0A2P6N2R7_9EUKA|nr:hypothetical protein PROFUN_13843 [Planoprotostelium fungivorum]
MSSSASLSAEEALRLKNRLLEDRIMNLRQQLGQHGMRESVVMPMDYSEYQLVDGGASGVPAGQMRLREIRGGGHPLVTPLNKLLEESQRAGAPKCVRDCRGTYQWAKFHPDEEKEERKRTIALKKSHTNEDVMKFLQAIDRRAWFSSKRGHERYEDEMMRVLRENDDYRDHSMRIVLCQKNAENWDDFLTKMYFMFFSETKKAQARTKFASLSQRANEELERYSLRVFSMAKEAGINNPEACGKLWDTMTPECKAEMPTEYITLVNEGDQWSLTIVCKAVDLRLSNMENNNEHKRSAKKTKVLSPPERRYTPERTIKPRRDREKDRERREKPFKSDDQP